MTSCTSCTPTAELLMHIIKFPIAIIGIYVVYFCLGKLIESIFKGY